MNERIWTCTNQACENYQLTITIHGNLQLVDAASQAGGYMVLFPHVICECGTDATRLKGK